MAIYLWFDSLTIRTCPGSSTDVWGGGGVKLTVSVKRKVQSADDSSSESEGEFEVSEVASLRVSYSILCIFRNPMLSQAPMLLHDCCLHLPVLHIGISRLGRVVRHFALHSAPDSRG